MIHYHGTPIGGSRQDTARFLQGRHALVPFTYQDDIGIVADVCKTFILDNGAFTVWKRGGTLDVEGYMDWTDVWKLHPGFQWALIPDVIDGDEAANDDLIDTWLEAGLSPYGVPVWHLHESFDRLGSLARRWPTVALGSSGKWSTPGTLGWWQRMNVALASICDDEGRPKCKLHGLRMLSPKVFTHLPLASADSTNAAVNGGSLSRFGLYLPPTSSQRSAVIADRIEMHNSAAVYVPVEMDVEFSLDGDAA